MSLNPAQQRNLLTVVECNAKATHILSAKIINIFAVFQDTNFNVMLANSISFAQLGLD